MLTGITLGQYLPGHSPVHNLDPRVKILLGAGLILGVFLIGGWGYAFLGGALLGAVLLARVPVGMVLKGLKPVLYLLLLTWLIHAWTDPGRILYTLGPLRLTWEGIREGFYIFIRLVLLMVGTTLITLTTSPLALTDALESLGRPARGLGVPVHELAMMVTIALRFIPTLLEETDRIMKAQMARGADFETGNLFQRARSLLPLLVPLFMSAFRRADELATAMEARCYRGGQGRTRMRELAMRRGDWLALGGGLVFFIGLSVLF